MVHTTHIMGGDEQVKDHALHHAVRHQHVTAVEYLLEAGAHVTAMSNGQSPLFVAFHQYQSGFAAHHCFTRSIIRHILSHMDDTSIQMPATIHNHSFVKQAPMPLWEERDLYQAMHETDLLQMLIDTGADTNAVDGPSGLTPLYYLVANSMTDSGNMNHRNRTNMATLLRAGVDVHMRNTDGDTVADFINRNIHRWSMGRDLYQELEALFMEAYFAKREALAMALHHRLGGVSRMGQLSEELIVKLTGRSYIPLTIRPTEDVFDENGHIKQELLLH
jgi:hypothetical protein